MINFTRSNILPFSQSVISWVYLISAPSYRETPADHLPEHVSEDEVNRLLIAAGLPKATKVISPKVTVQYYSIYMTNVPPSEKSSHAGLVLQVSGRHLSLIKTENEVGVIS